MKKKLLLINTFISLIICYLLALNVYADGIHIPGSGFFSFDINEDGATITFYQLDSYIETLIIPSKIRGYTTIEIAENAFITQSSIKDVTIPKSINKIGIHAIGYAMFKTSCGTFYTGYGDITIRGYKGTAAEIYAKQNGFKFIALDDEPEVTTSTTSTSQTTTTSTTVSTTVTSKITTETTKSTTSTTTSSTTITTNSTTTISTSASSTSGSTTTSAKSTSKDTTTDLTTPLTTTSSTTSETTPTTTNVKGDANNDNKLDVRDAACIAKKLAQGKAKDLPKWADFNEDGTVNVRDAADIARYLALRKK